MIVGQHAGTLSDFQMKCSIKPSGEILAHTLTVKDTQHNDN